MNINPTLSNETLEQLIKQANLFPENERYLLSELPYMDEEDRKSVLAFLLERQLLQVEKEEEVARAKNFQNTGSFDTPK